jgi:ribosome-associated protein
LTRIPPSNPRAAAPAALRRAGLAARAASDKLATDVLVLDVADVLSITDAFVLASATNTRQVRTIAEEVERVLKEDDGGGSRSVEGLDDASWVLLDFGDVIVHVFLAETRSYYDLERLWGDAPTFDWTLDLDQSEAARS